MQEQLGTVHSRYGNVMNYLLLFSGFFSPLSDSTEGAEEC